MKKLVIIAVALVGWGGVAVGGTPLPTTNEVQRVTPSRCPVGTTPVVNAQGAGADAPMIVTTAVKMVKGNGTRQIYTFISDADFCLEYGTVADGAPAQAPTGGGANLCANGAYYPAKVLFWEDVFPANRADVACATGTCHISTVECNP
jgi:hypothetical protein